MSRSRDSAEYILGADPEELDRLRAQHETWRELTDEAFDRAGVAAGWKVLDAGCGPGLVLADLEQRVGASGELWGVDQSEEMIAAARQRTGRDSGPKIRLLHGTLPEVALPPDHFDLIWTRWVLSFPPHPEKIVAALAASLKPGGQLLVVDYNHDGVGLWPDSPGFRAAIRATRAMYDRSGSDPWLGTRLPALMRGAGLVPEDYRATVLSGGPDSAVFQWAKRFFLTWADKFVAQGHMTPEEAELMRSEWQARSTDPDSRFFSPIVVTASARRPA